MGEVVDYLWILFMLGVLLGIILWVGIPILAIKITCDYLAKQIAKENKKLLQEVQANQTNSFKL